jgi:hypothetical protein
VHDGPPGSGQPDGTPLDQKPDLFDAVTCQLMNIGGRSTGVWQIWGGGGPDRWMAPMRMLCRIVCQLSEVTLVTRLQQEPHGFAPYELDPQRTGQFFRVRTGQLSRWKQGPWSVASVQPFAAQHLKVAIDEAIHSRETLTQFLRRDAAGAVEKKLQTIVKQIGANPLIEDRDRGMLVALLERMAAGEKGYFGRVVAQSGVPQSFTHEWAQVETGDASEDARRLIDWALEKKTNPANPALSTLASLLLPEVSRMTLPDAALVVATISAYRLIHDNQQMADLRIRYQSPLALPAASPAQGTGPEIDWRGPEDLQLQSWIRPDPPDFYNIAFLIKAIQHAASVCLITLPGGGETGTGFLVGERLVLTNYHVVQSVLSNEGSLPDASLIEVTFGKFGEGSTTLSTTLDKDRPVLEWSRAEELDFALLQLSTSLDGATNRAATLSSKTPEIKAALNILQHPRGGDMQLAPSDNAVTYVDSQTGLIQYVTRTASGSSGAPCFDDGWSVAAIHHAERSRPFGVIREGILIGPIRERIEKHLN